MGKNQISPLETEYERHYNHILYKISANKGNWLIRLTPCSKILMCNKSYFISQVSTYPKMSNFSVCFSVLPLYVFIFSSLVPHYTHYTLSTPCVCFSLHSHNPHIHSHYPLCMFLFIPSHPHIHFLTHPLSILLNYYICLPLS